MAIRLSRRKVAQYFVKAILAGKQTSQLLHELAAYLLDTKRTKELELITRDIEYVFSHHGVVVADIVTASELTSALRQAISKLVRDRLDAKTVELRARVEPTVLGGIKLDVAGLRLDDTLSHRLTTLRAQHKI